jgi:hypothetical protein
MKQALTQEELSIIDKVEKLLRLAGNNPNEHEASAASAKAMALLEAYNLDMFTVERNSGKMGKREDTKFAGGLYPWQRYLWNEVAQLHFCRYWFIRGLRKGQAYEHRVLGRHENVVGTRVMAEYLQQTIERLAREWAGCPQNYFTKSAISYRDGMSARLVSRLTELRYKRLREDEAKREEDAARARSSGTAPGTAVMLADVAQAEEDANNDYLHGEGFSAGVRARRAKAQADYEAQVKKQEEYDAAHPEEAAARKAKEEKDWADYMKKQGKRKQRAHSGPKYKGDVNAYWDGHAKGGEVGLDLQVDANATRRVK